MLKYFIVSPTKQIPKFDKFLSKVEKELSSFFGININHPSIFFLNSRKDIDKIWDKKTESWLCAWVRNGNIFILNPKIYHKESNHKAKDFWQTIKHEYSHLFFGKLTGVNYPKWLNEGLACYLAKQTNKKPSQDEALKIFNYFEKQYDYNIYKIGYFWVKILIEKFGKHKFLALLKELRPGLDEYGFKRIFYKIYKIKFTKRDLAIFLKKQSSS